MALIAATVLSLAASSIFIATPSPDASMLYVPAGICSSLYSDSPSVNATDFSKYLPSASVAFTLTVFPAVALSPEIFPVKVPVA